MHHLTLFLSTQLMDLLRVGSSDGAAPVSDTPADALRPALEGLLDAAALPVKGLLASGGHDLHAALLHLPLAGEPAPRREPRPPPLQSHGHC